jgi:hypothetical protein
MADETVDTQGGSDTDWEGEYKKLQRKLNRQQGKARDSTQRMAELEAGQRRSEQLLEAVLEASTLGNDELMAKTSTIRRDLESQRSSDNTAARFEGELNQFLDDSDADWGSDERLAEARKLLEEVNRTGDVSRLSEVKRLTQEALAPNQESGDIDGRIQDAILKDRQAHGRVDTGTSVGGGQRFTRQNVADLDPIKLGVKGMREVLDKVYDQMQN